MKNTTFYTSDDEGWKVNITPKVDKLEDTEDEPIEKLTWSRKKKIQVLSILIILVIAVCIGLNMYIGRDKDTDIDRFIRLLKGGAYQYAYNEYILSGEDVDDYSEYVNSYYDEIVNRYNETEDKITLELIYRYNEVYEDEFDIDTDFFYDISDSKQSYNYALRCYEKNDNVEAYKNFSYVHKKDVNYKSARNYMKKIKELSKDKMITFTFLYTNEQEKLVAKKLEEMYEERKDKDVLFGTEFEYRQVTEDKLDEGLKEGEVGCIFREDCSYFEYDTYGIDTEILVYNEEYFSDEDIRDLESIINKELPIQNIYIPLEKGNIISGLISTYDGSLYGEYEFDASEFDASEFDNNYSISLSKYSVCAIMDYVRQLKDNPNVYTGEDGIEKFVNGDIAAMIVMSDEYLKIKEKLGEGYIATQLPYVTCEDIGSLEKRKRLQGVNKCKGIDFVFADRESDYPVDTISTYVYETEFVNYISNELKLYNEYEDRLFSSNDDYVESVKQQVVHNFNNVDYYLPDIQEKMDELAAFCVKATSREEIDKYIDGITWLFY